MSPYKNTETQRLNNMKRFSCDCHIGKTFDGGIATLEEDKGGIILCFQYRGLPFRPVCNDDEEVTIRVNGSGKHFRFQFTDLLMYCLSHEYLHYLVWKFVDEDTSKSLDSLPKVMCKKEVWSLGL